MNIPKSHIEPGTLYSSSKESEPITSNPSGVGQVPTGRKYNFSGLCLKKPY